MDAVVGEKFSDKGPSVKAECLPTTRCFASSNHSVGVISNWSEAVSTHVELFSCGRDDERELVGVISKLVGTKAGPGPLDLCVSSEHAVGAGSAHEF